MKDIFPNTASYIDSLAEGSFDQLDVLIKEFLEDEDAYERASQALRRRFSRGAEEVEALDRGKRLTKIKRELRGGRGNYIYSIQGEDGKWSTPDERIWIVAMYGLWQRSK